MRICHVITKPELGGAQLSTLNILANLPKDKYDVSLITSPKGMLSSDFRNLKGVSTIFCPFLIRPINSIFDILGLIHIYLIYRCRAHKIVHTHSSKAGLIGRWAARIARVPVIVHTVHGWSFNDYQPLILKWLYILLERLTARFTTKIICVSNRDIGMGLRYKIAPKDKFVLIKYGIPLEEFRKPPVNNSQKRKELGINNSGPIVGMISCLKPQKAPMDYIKAAINIYNDMPGVNFLLVGDGVLKEKCIKLLSRTPLNGRFVFSGWRRDIPEILDILDVVVLTSKWEGMPISIIEALSKGCPVVITNVGGAEELVKDGISGYLTKPGSYEEVAMKVLKILKDRNTFIKMSEAASLSIDESFDIKNMVNSIDTFYGTLYFDGAKTAAFRSRIGMRRSPRCRAP
jgi:glycosyltransferase involved in cell wall biosynthesis